MSINSLICKIFGHRWIFPFGVMYEGNRRIKASDYVCGRCKAVKGETCLEELVRKWSK